MGTDHQRRSPCHVRRAALPARGSFRRAAKRVASFERSAEADNPLMRDVSDLIPEQSGHAGSPTAIIASAELALRASEAATSDNDDHSDIDSDDAVEYTEDFDSSIATTDGNALE